MKKVQVAMEFFMAYGWAILVVLAAIGAFFYFNVLDIDALDKFRPDVVYPDIQCQQLTSAEIAFADCQSLVDSYECCSKEGIGRSYSQINCNTKHMDLIAKRCESSMALKQKRLKRNEMMTR